MTLETARKFRAWVWERSPSTSWLSRVTKAAMQPAGGRQGDVRRWEDVTEMIDAATREMEVGQMLHAPSFSMVDAMAAIELGDPKMDVGAGRRVRLEQCELPGELTPSQLVGVMDKLVSGIVSWVTWTMLPHNECVYLYRIDSLSDPCLLCFCKLTVALSAVIRDIVTGSSVGEEEDSVPIGFAFHVDRIPIGEAEILMNKALQHCTTNYQAEDGSHYFANAIRSRLLLFFHLYRALLEVENPTPSSFETAKYVLYHCSENLDTIKKSLIIVDDDAVPGFEPLLNRHLQSSAPPRKSPQLKPEEGFSRMSDIASGLSLACSLPTFLAEQEQLTTRNGGAEDALLFRFLDQLAAISGQRGPGILVRTVLARLVAQLPVFVTNGSWALAQLVLRAMGTPLITHVSPEKRNQLSNSLATTVYDLLMILLHNRGRQRRGLAEFLVDWGNHCNRLCTRQMVDENEEAFQSIRQFAKRVALFSTRRLLLLGFECNLYAPFELSAVFGYLLHISSDKVASTTFSGYERWLCRGYLAVLSSSSSTPLPLFRRPGAAKRWYEQRFSQAACQCGPEHLTFDGLQDLIQREKDEASCTNGDGTRSSEQQILTHAQKCFEAATVSWGVRGGEMVAADEQAAKSVAAYNARAVAELLVSRLSERD